MSGFELSSERWRIVEAILDRVLDAPEDARERVLVEACGSDSRLRAEVESLLAAGQAPAFFDTDAASFAGPAFTVRATRGSGTVPHTLGTYRLVREIGAGGMSRVFLAERKGDEFQQKVAVKILRAVGLGLDEGAVRFRAERQILASLDHPAIARVFDGGTTEAGLPYLVMEYVDGKPITAVCNDGSLSLAERLDLFERVCDAVAFAHSRLIVHRDLKPSNILVTDDLRVKLLDFGIAKLLDPTSFQLSDTPLTRTGLFLLTPEYAAPEQLRGETVTTATDVYGLGALLYELLTGQRPHRPEIGVSAAGDRSHSGSEPPKPSTVASNGRSSGNVVTPLHARDLRGDLDTLVLKALRDEPRDRYRSVNDLRDDLIRYREGRPISARPATVRYRIRKFVARNRIGVGAAVVVAGALALGAVGTLWQARQANEEARRAQAVGGFLVDLFEGADPELRPGESITALELLESGAARLDSLAGGATVRVDLKRTLGQLFAKIGEAERAQTLLRSAYSEAGIAFGPRDARTDEARLALGRHLARTGDPAEAEQLLRGALETARAEGYPPLDLAERITSLAVVLADRAAFDESESLLREAISIQQRVGDPDAPALGEELVTLGSIELKREDFAAAEGSYRTAAEIRERRLGSEHIDVAAALWGLAAVHLRAEDFSRAEDVLRRTLAIRRAAYPDGHPDIARTLSQLAGVVTWLGRLDEASSLFSDALEAWQERFGRNRSDLAEIYADAGVLAYRRGDAPSAAELTRQALEIYRAVFSGDDHENVASCLSNLAVIERDLGYAELALSRATEALEIRRRLYDSDNLYIALSLTNLAVLKRNAGDLAAAEPLLRESESLHSEKLGDESPALAVTRTLLASVLVQRGATTEALSILQDTLRVLSQRYTERDARVAETRLWLGVALAQLDRPQEARPHLESALSALEAAFPEAPLTVRARDELRKLAR